MTSLSNLIHPDLLKFLYKNIYLVLGQTITISYERLFPKRMHKAEKELTITEIQRLKQRIIFINITYIIWKDILLSLPRLINKFPKT